MGIRRKERDAGRGGGFMLGLAVVGLTAMVLLAGRIFGFIDFGTTEIDRSQPPLLVQLSDLAEYRAATSNFELVVDLEKDVKFLPDFVAGERSVMVAAGTVDAKVDFSGLTEQNIEFGLKMAGIPKSERRDRVASALQMVHLTRSANKLVHELSGGMRANTVILRKSKSVAVGDENRVLQLSGRDRLSVHDGAAQSPGS